MYLKYISEEISKSIIIVAKSSVWYLWYLWYCRIPGELHDSTWLDHKESNLLPTISFLNLFLILFHNLLPLNLLRSGSKSLEYVSVRDFGMDDLIISHFGESILPLP